MFSDFREFLSLLEGRGLLKKVEVPVDPQLEVTEIVLRVSQSGGPALLFERPKGSIIPIAINLFGSEERMAMALCANNLEEVVHRIKELLDLIKPSSLWDGIKTLTKIKDLVPKERKKPPFKENILRGEDVDLSLLPALKCWPKDAGRFITLPVVVVKDPELGNHNLGMYRMQIIDKKRTAMHWQIHKDGRRIAEKYEGKVPVAVSIGCHPAFIYLATAPIPYGLGDYIFGAIVAGRQLEVARTDLHGLLVPYDSEIVLEGYVDTRELIEEGPFGDHTGHYTPKDFYPVFHVEAMYMRKDPIYAATVVGRPYLEDAFFGLATERIFLPLAKKVFPEIVDWHIPKEGVFHNFLFVSIRKSYPGHAFRIINGLWGMSGTSTMKHIVVFDHSIDVHDLGEVLWAWGNNVDPSRDVVINKGPLDALDHACGGKAFGGRMGIDATRKWGEEGISSWPETLRMKEEIKELVERRWKEYGL